VSTVTPIFVSVKQAAAMLNLTPWSIYQLLNRGDLEARYHGKRRLIVAESVHRYAESLPSEAS